jgi:hypothetical protein
MMPPARPSHWHVANTKMGPGLLRDSILSTSRFASAGTGETVDGPGPSDKSRQLARAWPEDSQSRRYFGT